MTKQFYYRADGQVFGPMSGDELRQWALEGRVVPDTEVRLGEEGNWVPASRVKGLFEEGGGEYKRCPYCAEQILAAAIKCKHCGEFLTEERPTRVEPKAEKTETIPSVEVPKVEEAQTGTIVASGTAEDVLLGVSLLVGVCWVIVFIIFLANAEEGGHWFVTLLVTSVASGILGAIIGSFKNAGPIGGLLGLGFGPLGVIGALAIDGRPQCSKCRGRLDGKPEVCPHCHVRLVVHKTSPTFSAKCPACSDELEGRVEECPHCSAELSWVRGVPCKAGEEGLVEARKKFNAALLDLMDSKGPLLIDVFHWKVARSGLLTSLRELGFVEQDNRSWLVKFLTPEVIRGQIDASRLRELALLPRIVEVRNVSRPSLPIIR